MKNLFFVCLFALASISLDAQDSLGIKAGFFFAPQGVISLQTPSKGFTSITPINAVVSFSKGNSVVNAMYNLTYNKVQVVYWHGLGTSTGFYVVGNKSVFAKGGYAGLGLTKSLAQGRATGFFEFGSPWDNWNPAIYTGAIIPLMFKAK